MNVQILQGDCRDVLKTLPDESVHCCVTSPPYWGLRSYLPDGHENKFMEIGLEYLHDCLGWGTGNKCGECYVCHLVQVFSEVKRVLRKDGTCFVVLGDTYVSQGGPEPAQTKWKVSGASDGQNRGNSRKPGNLKPKNLVGIPWSVAFAMRADGWWLRSDIIWSKPNCMPSSVTDRPTTSHEYVFLLAKSERYFYDNAAIMENSMNAGKRVILGEKSFSKGQAKGANVNPSGNGLSEYYDVASFRNRRSVWTVSTQPYSGAHFATFPPALIEPMILAGCPENGTVLDPFAGSGTTGQVAERLGRNAILIELNPEYLPLVERRTAQAGLELSFPC